MMADSKGEAIAHRAALVDLIVDHVRANPAQTNAEIAAALGLESSFEGRQRNYLSFTLLTDAVKNGRLIRQKHGHNVRYVCP